MLTNRFARLARAALMACALGGAILASGCGKPAPSFENLDITGNTQFGTDFSLPDASGKTHTLEDYKGKVVVLFFGYTHCPDVCPTTMAELAQALQQLGPTDASRVQVLFGAVTATCFFVPGLKYYRQRLRTRLTETEAWPR